jgi:hypothetical protein
MGNIISLNSKIQLAKEKKAVIIRKRKIQTVQKIFQCTQCAFKCEKCGTQISMDRHDIEEDDNSQKTSYRFCGSCSEEYIDYIKRTNGEGNPDCYWHNEAWIKVWKTWIDYQGSIDRYLKSKEFIQLLNEIKQTKPDK